MLEQLERTKQGGWWWWWLRKESWEKISPDVRVELLKVAVEAGREIKSRGRAEANEAVVAMQKRKLVVTQMTPEALALWDAAADRIRDRIRGPVVPPDLYDAVHAHLKDFRAKGGAGSQ